MTDWGRTAIGMALVVVVFLSALTAPLWHRQTTAGLDQRPPIAAAPPAIDWAPWRAELDACRARTDALRMVLETLIKVWPGRARLPESPAGWPAWPAPGVAREWKADGW